VPTFRLDLAYDGSGFHGFARQPGVRTVQGELESVLSRLSGEPVSTVCAGRTDAGVHARKQVVSFEVGRALDPARIQKSINRMLGPEVVCTSARLVDDGFDARRSARWRSYRYQVLCSPYPDPLLRHVTWHVPPPLDVDAMDRVVQLVVGEHDFSSFCRRAEGRSNVRRVLQAAWRREGSLTVCMLQATAFCHQMVRSIVGLCVDIGRGRRPPEAMAAALRGSDRSLVPTVAPPGGLILWDVGYDDGS
jgi:tRNA pseudouridine38-40 synthase